MSQESNNFIKEYTELKEAVKNMSKIIAEHHNSISELDNLLAIALNENLNLEKENAKQKEHIYILSEKLESVIDVSSKGKKTVFRDSVESTLKNRISEKNKEVIEELAKEGTITPSESLEKDSIFVYDLEDIKNNYQRASMIKEGQLGKKVGDSVDVGNGPDEVIIVTITALYNYKAREPNNEKKS